MAERVWHSGPPPHVGWWNASACYDDDAWRWWNGECWSPSVYAYEPIRAVVRAASMHTVFCTGEIEWTDYWPENARVPRIDPREAAGGGEG